MKQLYKNYIIELYQKTDFKGQLDDYTFISTHQNPLCGDTVTFYVLLIGQKVEKIRFSASGCVLSQAAATCIAQTLEGNHFDLSLLSNPEYLQQQLGLSLGISRLRCIMLPVECLKTGAKEIRHAI